MPEKLSQVRSLLSDQLNPILLMRSIHATANEILRRAYLFIVRNETIDPKIRSAAMLKLNAFPREVSSLSLSARIPSY